MFGLVFNSKIRISSNLLFDEYELIQLKKKSKQHGYGYSHKISLNLKDESKIIINAIIRISKLEHRHLGMKMGIITLLLGIDLWGGCMAVMVLSTMSGLIIILNQNFI